MCVVSKTIPESGSSEGEQTGNHKSTDEGAEEDSEEEEENRAPELKKLPVRLFFRCTYFQDNFACGVCWVLSLVLRKKALN